MTRIAPATMAAILMGVWFLSSFAANLLLGYVAGMLESEERGAVFHFLEGQADFFMILASYRSRGRYYCRDRGAAVPSDARPGIAVWVLFHTDLAK